MMFCKKSALLALGLMVVAAPALAEPSSHAQPSRAESRAQPPAPPVSISWLPEWLKEPVSRAIADATNPRPRD